uniref:Uncharacterized protein n=1 Tax=Anopheles maculatus TaxID=74869 RepID=A0A182S6A1_9DIPT
MAPTTPTTTSSGGTGRSSSGATPPTATTTSTITTTASLSSPSHPNARSSGAQAFDFTLQPPTSSSSSSGTQPHSSSSPSAVAPNTTSPLPAPPRAKSKQKPELETGSNRAVTQPNESESLRTERPKAPAPSAPVSGRGECTVADAGQPPNSTLANEGCNTGTGPSVKTDGKTTTSAALASHDSGVIGEATRRDAVVVRRSASGTVHR